MPDSLSRRLASWAAALRYEDLPPEVVDRAKGVTLHGLTSALIGAGTPAGQQALDLMQAEDGAGAGVATALVSGARLTKASAGFVNAEIILAGGKWDTFRMLTHPGAAILPAALAMGEVTGASGRDYLTAVAAGYEVLERLAGEFIPTVMSRGFHAGPVFGIFGAAVAAAKLQGLNADQIHGAIAQCVNLAAGNLEGNRSGGGRVREGTAVRNALLAVGMARQGGPAGETVLEGEAGFYHAYTGNNQGRLTYSFGGHTRTNLEDIAAGLGADWRFLETLYRVYSTAGYNIAHIDVTAALCAEHDIQPEDVDRVEAVVNWLETQYPSPAFPTRGGYGGPAAGGTEYFSAWGVVKRGFPILKTGPAPDDPPEVLDLMKRVTLIPAHNRSLFGPRVTIHLKDGTSFSKDGTGREFIWDFEEEVRRIRGVAPGIPVSAAQFEQLMDTCRNLDSVDRAAQLIELSVPRGKGAHSRARTGASARSSAGRRRPRPG